MDAITKSAITFFVSMARWAGRDYRRYRRMGEHYLALAREQRGQRFAFLLAARYIHPSLGARVRNARRRAA